MENIQQDVYLFFTGNCKEAMEWYKEVFGGDLTSQTYGEMSDDKLPEPMQKMKDKVMHSVLKGGVVRLMASDSTRDSFGESFVSLSLSGTDEAQLSDLFKKLADGGKITQPLEKSPWEDLFGMVTDKFGVDWMVNITAPTKEAN